jgi:hypothetical protein
MAINILVFWVMTLCNDVVGNQCFRQPCCLHLLGMMNGAGKGHRYRQKYKKG